MCVLLNQCTFTLITVPVGMVRVGYWVAIAFGVVFLISDVALWLAVLGYTVENSKWHIMRTVVQLRCAMHVHALM